MRKIFILIFSVIAINTAFAQSFGSTAEIINSDCRIQFNNTNGTKIFELIGENLTWWRQSNNSIVIRDKVTQVTIASNYSGTPAFSALDDSLDAWILACKDCCSGGSSGGGCLESCTITENVLINADGNSVVFEGINDKLIIDGFVDIEGDSIPFTGIHSEDGVADIIIGVAGGIFPNNIALSQIQSDSGTASLYGAILDTFPAILLNIATSTIDYGVNVTKDGVTIIGNNLPEYPLIIGNPGTGYILFGNTGNIQQDGAYSNTAIEINSAGGSDTISENKLTYLYNPASLQASATITLPLSPQSGQILHIVFGGTITSGTVVTALTLAAGVNGINAGTVTALATVETPLTFQFISALNKWFLLSN